MSDAVAGLGHDDLRFVVTVLRYEPSEDAGLFEDVQAFADVQHNEIEVTAILAMMLRLRKYRHESRRIGLFEQLAGKCEAKGAMAAEGVEKRLILRQAAKSKSLAWLPFETLPSIAGEKQATLLLTAGQMGTMLMIG